MKERAPRLRAGGSAARATGEISGAVRVRQWR